MKILLIDDNVDTSTMLAKFLKLKGYECDASNNGRNGLALLNSKNFDVVLLDLAMPEFSGYDIVEQLHQSRKLNENKIIIFTASSLNKEEIQMLMDKGVHTILQKPIELRLLIKALEV